MATTRTAILDDIKTAIAAVTGMHAERVSIGLINPGKVGIAPVAGIFWQRDQGRLGDGTRSERELLIITACIVRIDPAKTTSQLQQLSETYDSIHAKLDDLADGGITGKVLSMFEHSIGIEAGGFDDDDSLVYVASAWTARYLRTLEAT